MPGAYNLDNNLHVRGALNQSFATMKHIATIGWDVSIVTDKLDQNFNQDEDKHFHAKNKQDFGSRRICHSFQRPACNRV